MHQRLHKLLLLTSLATALAGCGGGSSNSPAPPPPGAGPTPTTAAQALRDMESRGELPILDRSTVLKGTDANSDGVRDDLERHIGSLPDSAQQKSAMRGMARALDSTLVVDVNNEASLRAAAIGLSETINCAWEVYPTDQASKRVEEIRRLAVNTKERFNAYAKYNQARSGSVIAIPSGSTCK